MEGATKIKFIPPEKLNLSTQFVDYNKQPIQILGALCTSIRSAGCDVTDATFLVTERRARCILGLDLQGKLGIKTTQKSAPSQNPGLMCYCVSSRKVGKISFTKNSRSYLMEKGNRKNFITAVIKSVFTSLYYTRVEVSESCPDFRYKVLACPDFPD